MEPVSSCTTLSCSPFYWGRTRLQPALWLKHRQITNKSKHHPSQKQKGRGEAEPPQLVWICTECRNSPTETPGTTGGPGALPPSSRLHWKQWGPWPEAGTQLTSGFGLYFTIISSQHPDLGLITRKFRSRPPPWKWILRCFCSNLRLCTVQYTSGRFLLSCFRFIHFLVTVLPSPTTQSLTASELSYTIWSTLILPTLNFFKGSFDSLPHWVILQLIHEWHSPKSSLRLDTHA